MKIPAYGFGVRLHIDTIRQWPDSISGDPLKAIKSTKMKTVQSPSPSRDPDKIKKANLFEKESKEIIEAMQRQSTQDDQCKVMLRIDHRTHVLVSPQQATLEYADILRKKYKIDLPMKKGGRRKQ